MADYFIQRQTPYTIQTSGVITIDTTDNIKEVTIFVTSGTITYQGKDYYRNSPSGPCVFPNGTMFTDSCTNANAVLSDVTIDCTGGQAIVIMRR